MESTNLYILLSIRLYKRRIWLNFLLTLAKFSYHLLSRLRIRNHFVNPFGSYCKAIVNLSSLTVIGRTRTCYAPGIISRHYHYEIGKSLYLFKSESIQTCDFVSFSLKDKGVLSSRRPGASRPMKGLATSVIFVWVAKSTLQPDFCGVFNLCLLERVLNG